MRALDDRKNDQARFNELIVWIMALGIAASLPTTALAQVDTSEWRCELCPFEQGYRAEYEVGGSYVSDDAIRFGNATGYDQKGGYVNLDGQGSYVDDDFQLDWLAEDLGLDSRVFVVDGGRQGRYGFRVAYSELPQRVFDSTRTIFNASGNDTLTLPQSWVRAPQTSGFTELSTSLKNRNIESDRQTMEVGGNFLAAAGIDVYADFRRQNRDGIDVVAGSSFTQASLLPRPFDYQTDEIDAGIRFGLGPVDLSLAWYGSFFKNNASSLTWDNPFTSMPGAEQGRLAQEPDNEFQQLSLAGSYRADAMDTVVAFSIAAGRSEQNDTLLPYTINPNIDAGALPRTTLDGQVDTLNYAFTLTARPHDIFRLRIAYRHDERDNQTTQSSWSRVIVDSFSSGESELNIPYSFARKRLNLSGDIRVFDSVHVSAGYDRTELERDFQEVAEQTEDTGWGRVRWRPNSYLDIKLRGGASRRDIDRYDTDISTNFGQNPLLRKYNLAYRYREFGELTFSASLPEQPVSFGLTALFADDSYSRSELGLTGAEETHVSGDLSWALSEGASLYLTGGIEAIDAEQTGSQLFAAPDWLATHEDEFTNFGGGFRIAGIADKADLLLDYTHTDGETKINVIDGSSPAQFPDLKSTLDSLRLTLDYHQSDRLTVNLQLRYESFSTEDWAISGVAPDTLPTILTLGATEYDYDVWVVGIGFRYSIGKNEIVLSDQ